MRCFTLLALLGILSAAHLPVDAATLLDSPHRGMACTACHISAPPRNPTAIETAPLIEGFRCLSCHEEETSASAATPGGTMLPLLARPRDLQWCTPYIGLGTSQDVGTGQWTVSVDYAVPDSSIAVALSVFISCVDDSTPVCVSPRPCATLNEPACAGFNHAPTWKCLSKMCIFGPILPGPFLVGPFDLPPRSDPYKIHAYLIHSPGVEGDCPPHFYTYECCEAEILVPATGAETITYRPSRYALLVPRPNPSAEGTTICFEAPHSGRATVEIYDVMGRLVTTILDASVGPGRHTRIWAGRDATGFAVSPGVYFVRLESGEFSATRKVVRTR